MKNPVSSLSERKELQKNQKIYTVASDITSNLSNNLAVEIFKEIDGRRFYRKSKFPLEENKLTKVLSVKYILPEGITEHHIWSVLQKDANNALVDNIHQELVKLNPLLQSIEVEDRDFGKWCVVGGVASRLPVSDIMYYLDNFVGNELDAWSDNPILDRDVESYTKDIDLEKYVDLMQHAIEQGSSMYEKFKDEESTHPRYVLAHRLYTAFHDNKQGLLDELKSYPMMMRNVIVWTRTSKLGIISFIPSPDTFFTKMLPMLDKAINS